MDVLEYITFLLVDTLSVPLLRQIISFPLFF